MPEKAAWESFFNVRCILESLVTGVESAAISVAEFGSGYGTFTLPLARMTTGQIHAFDIESGLIEQLAESAAAQGLTNIVPVLRDFVAAGTGLANECVEHAMLYNILHIEDPVALLSEAYRIIQPEGSVSIIHWRSDMDTPRGPSLSIRPTPRQIHCWLAEAGFSATTDVDLGSSPYHFGIKAFRPRR